MIIKIKLSIIFLIVAPFACFSSFASKVDTSSSNEQVLKDIEIKGKKHFQVKAGPKGQLYFAILKDQKIKNQVPVKGVKIKPLKDGQKKRKQSELPIVELKNIESFSDDIGVVSITIAPVDPASEIAEQTQQVKIVKDDHIIDGPEFNSIGMGEGGALREFDFSKLKKHKQIQILLWLGEDRQGADADLKVIRKDSMGGETFSIVAEETYTWNGSGFDKKVHLDE